MIGGEVDGVSWPPCEPHAVFSVSVSLYARAWPDKLVEMATWGRYLTWIGVDADGGAGISFSGVPSFQVGTDS